MKKLLKRRTTNPVQRWFADESSREKASTSDLSRIIREIRPGDVLVIEGRSFFSRLVMLFTRSPWTHCALYVGHSADILKHQHKRIAEESDPHSHGAWLIEANLGEGVVASPLEKYARHNVRICRPRNLSTRARQKAISKALSYLDDKYNLLLIFRLAAYLMVRWAFQFDDRGISHLFWDTSRRVICTSLIWRSFYSVRFVVFPLGDRFKSDQHHLQKGTTFLTPSIFLQSPNFQVIRPLGFCSAAETRWLNDNWRNQNNQVNEV
ncbi:MAG: YiiX/YebB-like N1pC/P60 family cysteine hydrolase [Gammaproteobacteria bacterium]